jgi:thiamine-phosphate pyrophosphorylase
MTEALRGFDQELLLASRDVRGDVGTHIMTASEMSRENPRAVLTANFKRTAEALRTLEEYGKLFDAWVGGRFEVLRYDVYTLEKLVLTAAASRRGLAEVKLMVLVGGLPTMGDLTWVVGEALSGGADAIQLREKGLPDREWLARAREVRILTAQAKARFIVNDRPDLARLAGADGVHLGQEDVSVRDARRIVGPNSLIGVSTHDPAQLDKAVLDAAGYLGVGPVFTSETKGFDDLAGLGFVRHAADATNLPWFAIGGIDESNLDEALEAGARRVAVSAAVVRAEYPRKAAAALKARLDAAWG